MPRSRAKVDIGNSFVMDDFLMGKRLDAAVRRSGESAIREGS
jgi:hypothetical protein